MADQENSVQEIKDRGTTSSISRSHTSQVGSTREKPQTSGTSHKPQKQEPPRDFPPQESTYSPSREADPAGNGSEPSKDAKLSSFASAWQGTIHQQGDSRSFSDAGTQTSEYGNSLESPLNREKGATPAGEMPDGREVEPWSKDDINGKIDSYQEVVKTTANAKKSVEYGKASLDTVKQMLGGKGGGTAAANTGNALSKGAEAGTFRNAMQGINKGLGPASLVAGTMGIAQGVDKLSNGSLLEGSLDIVGGTGATVSGAATTASAYTSATTVAGVSLSTLAGAGGGVGAIADGVGDIYQGVKEKNLEKGVVGSIKTGAGAAMIAGACTANPFLVAGGAAAYTGALVYENREAITEFGKNAYNTAAEGVKSGATATGEFTDKIARRVSEKASRIKEGAEQLIEEGKHKAAELKDTVIQKAQSIKKAVSETIEKAQESAAAAASSVTDSVRNTWNWAASWF